MKKTILTLVGSGLLVVWSAMAQTNPCIWNPWTVATAPTISVTVNSPGNQCIGTQVSVTATAATTGGTKTRTDNCGNSQTNTLALSTPTWTWSLSGITANVTSGTTNTATFTPTSAGTATVTFTATATTTDPNGTYSATNSVTFTVVAVQSITVINGPTGPVYNVSGADWAAVKDPFKTALVEVTLNPNTDAAASALTWSMGDPVTGYPRRRSISLATPSKSTVTASCGTSSASLNIWVIWAQLSIALSTADTISTGNDASSVLPGHVWPADRGGGNNLGPNTHIANPAITYAFAIGKEESRAVLQPPGIETLLPNGWQIVQYRQAIAWDNGGTPSLKDPGFVPDPSSAGWYDLVPNSGTSAREIYALDVPGCSTMLGLNINHTSESYANFKNSVSVTLGGLPWTCSDTILWSYEAQVDVDNNRVDDNILNSFHITLPSAPHYTTR